MAMQAEKMQGQVSRRTFLAGSAGATLVMGIGAVLPGCSKEEAATDVAAGDMSRSFAPTVWFEIDSDGGVLVNIAKAEMGQHVGTALARIVADELGADVDLEDARERVYGMPYSTWKSDYQTEATPEQLAAMEAATKQ